MRVEVMESMTPARVVIWPLGCVGHARIRACYYWYAMIEVTYNQRLQCVSMLRVVTTEAADNS